MNRYSVIATIGPATESALLRRSLIRAGADAFRLNTSHMSVGAVLSTLEELSQIRSDVPVVLDLQGSKWRLGEFPEVALASGDTVTLVHGAESRGTTVLPVPHGDFFRAVRDCPGGDCPGEIRLNDGRVVLQVESVLDERVRCTVRTGGTLSARKGLTVPGTPARAESLGDRDEEILRKTRGAEQVAFAFSYVRDAGEMKTFREIVDGANRIIAKIERASAVSDAPAIATAADEVWLCRGDLGAELGPAEMARTVHRFSRSVRDLASPCLLAGQVLEHMTVSSRATRSELTVIYDALQAGYAGFVLSDETATGAYPVESCRTAALFRE